MQLVLWIVTALLIGLWSAIVWGLHALLSIDLGAVGAMAAQLDRLPAAPWLDGWMPGWREWAVLAAEWTRTMWSWVGTAAPVLAWVLWGVGTAGLLLCALIGSAIVALVRKAASVATAPAAATVSRSA